MLTKVQGKTLRGEMTIARPPKLSAMEKGMLKWAVVNMDDKVLDASIGSGLMAEYLRRNLQCEVCGVSSEMEDVRRARARLQSCDIVYACRGDIPWREEAFDTVLYPLHQEEPDQLRRMLGEVLRVLKPGGQLVLGLPNLPGPLDNAVRLWTQDSLDAPAFFDRVAVEQQLNELSFQKITWQRTAFACGVLIAWKPKGDVNTFLQN